MNSRIALVALTLFLTGGFVSAAESELTSPDTTLCITVSDVNGLTYHVDLDGKPVLANSKLGLTFQGDVHLGLTTRIEKTTRSQNDTTWENRFGKRRLAHNHYNEMRLELAEAGAVPCRFALVVRAYDDGIAFRYDLPRQPVLNSFTLTDERTEFAFPDNYRCWGGEFSICAENNYPQCHLNDIQKASVLPLLVELPHAYAVIAESDLIDWAGMFVTGNQKQTIKVSLAKRNDGSGLVKSQTPRLTPWRVLLIGRKAADLVASDLIDNLATPSQIADVSWIKPGVAAWDPWWAKSVKTRGTTETDKPYIDLAATMGWQYQLVDWGWYKKSDVTSLSGSVDVPELLTYAKEKNLQLLLWMHSKDLKATGIDKAFSTVSAWGVPGVKIDFMNSDSQETVQWYYSTLQTAAKYKLMIDFHGAYKPTGLARTWPNYITQEGVLGNEYNKLPGNKCNPLHHITLPFTRGLLGPMDFTPGGFVNRTPHDFVRDAGAKPNGNCQVMGTRARQLAMTILYESPLLCMADSPKSYLHQPGVEFLRTLPTVWDDTVVLSADVCRRLALARRSGNTWYLAAMNANDALVLKLSLTFLDKGSWTLRSFADTPDSATQPESIQESTRTIRPDEVLEISLAPAGGFTAILTPTH